MPAACPAHVLLLAACKFTAATNVVRCTWPVLNLNDVKKVSVKTRVNEAGTWLQPACVTTTSNDTDPSNNCDNCTVSARVRTVPSAAPWLPGCMPRIVCKQQAPHGRSQRGRLRAAFAQGACCLRSFTTAACSNVLPSQCNAGTYSKNATCSQLTTCVPLPKERGACCLPTKASQRAALKAGAKAGAAEQPDAKHKGAATQKDDAKQASAARKGAAAQKDAAKQAGAAQKGASAHKGRALHASVEATKQMGTCMEGVTKEVCLAAHGTWFPSSTCRVSCPVPVPIPGACCDQRTGTCRDNVAQANCPPPAMWAADTQCRADGFCTGACCDMASGQCEQTLKVDCQTDSWAIYQQCSETCGPVSGCRQLHIAVPRGAYHARTRLLHCAALSRCLAALCRPCRPSASPSGTSASRRRRAPRTRVARVLRASSRTRAARRASTCASPGISVCQRTSRAAATRAAAAARVRGVLGWVAATCVQLCAIGGVRYSLAHPSCSAWCHRPRVQVGPHQAPGQLCQARPLRARGQPRHRRADVLPRQPARRRRVRGLRLPQLPPQVQDV